MLHLWHKPGTRVALHGFLHPVVITIVLNCLWNLKHLSEKQKMPFPSSNHRKETKSLHWDHRSAAQVAPVEDKSLQLFTVIYQMLLTTFNFTFKWESDLEMFVFLWKKNMAENWSTTILIHKWRKKTFYTLNVVAISHLFCLDARRIILDQGVNFPHAEFLKQSILPQRCPISTLVQPDTWPALNESIFSTSV